MPVGYNTTKFKISQNKHDHKVNTEVSKLRWVWGQLPSKFGDYLQNVKIKDPSGP